MFLSEKRAHREMGGNSSTTYHPPSTLLLLKGPACPFLDGLWINRQTYSEKCILKTYQQVLASSKNHVQQY